MSSIFYSLIGLSISASLLFSPNSGERPEATQDYAAQELSEKLIQSNSFDAIGKIFCKSRSTTLGSNATVVRNRTTLLTVAHYNLDEINNLKIQDRQCRFEIKAKNGTLLFRSKFREHKRGGNLNILRISRAADWAVLRLDSPLPATIDPAQLYTPPSDGSIGPTVMVGYARGHGNFKRRFVTDDCQAESQANMIGLIIHHCTLGPGSSGAPIFALVQGRAKIIAIHAAQLSENGIAVRMFNGPVTAINASQRYRRSARAVLAKGLGEDK